jgi:hypothetical protein
MERTYSTHGEERNLNRILVQKLEGKKLLGRYKRAGG